MSVLLGSVPTAQIRDALDGILKSEMNVGPNGPGTGDNLTGRLQSVLAIHRSISVGPAFPAIGVQLRSVRQTPYSSNRMDYAATFLILIAVEAAVDPTTNLILLDNANDQLQAIQDDGAGNGIEPILLDIKNFQLPQIPVGAILTTYITEWNYAWEDPELTDSDPRAYAVATYVVSGQVLRR